MERKRKAGEKPSIYMHIMLPEAKCNYSRTSIIRTPVCHFNVKGVQINKFVQISELSAKMHYLGS